jgi:hypothetical protein
LWARCERSACPPPRILVVSAGRRRMARGTRRWDRQSAAAVARDRAACGAVPRCGGLRARRGGRNHRLGERRKCRGGCLRSGCGRGANSGASGTSDSAGNAAMGRPRFQRVSLLMMTLRTRTPAEQLIPVGDRWASGRLGSWRSSERASARTRPTQAATLMSVVSGRLRAVASSACRFRAADNFRTSN